MSNICPVRDPIAGHAIEFIPLGERLATTAAIVALVKVSFLEEYSSGKRARLVGVLTGEKVKERMKVAFSLYSEFRDPDGIGWEHRKVMDHLPMLLRCKLDGASWTDYVTETESDFWSRTGLVEFGARAHGTDPVRTS